MIPPSFSDIGKPANDLLSKDFPVGSAKLEVNTTTPNGIKFTVNGNKDNKTGGIVADLKAKYSDKVKGLTFTETWSSANVIGASLEVENQLAKGLKLDVSGSIAPEKNTKAAKAGFEYKQDFIFTRSSLDLIKGPTLFADVTLGHCGLVGGADVGYDVSEGKVVKYNVGLSYIDKLFSVSLLGANKLSTFSVAYHHKVNSSVEAGAKAIYNKGSDSGVAIEVGTKYTLDSTAFLKAKVDNFGRLGLGYTQVLRDGIKLSLGGLFDTTRLASDVHKVGLSLSFEA